MNVVFFLILAAWLEVGGDALVRYGLKQARWPSVALGALVLALYGLCVNLPRWDFGRLLGVYIAVFFMISQFVAFWFFQERLKPATLVGGSLIVLGGLVLTFWRHS